MSHLDKLLSAPSLEEQVAALAARVDVLEAKAAEAPDRALAGFLRFRKRARALDLAAKQKEGA